MYAAALLLAAAAVGNAAEPVSTVRLAGGDSAAWIVQDGPDPENPRTRAVQIFVARRSPGPAPQTPPIWKALNSIQGFVQKTAAARDELFLLFSDQAMSAVTPTGGASPLPRLPSGWSVLALAGDSSGEALYVIARGPAAGLLDDTAPAATANADSGMHLFQVDVSDWRDLGSVPPRLAEAGQIWMTARDGRVLALFPSPSDAASGAKSAEAATSSTNDQRGAQQTMSVAGAAGSQPGESVVHGLEVAEWVQGGWGEPAALPGVNDVDDVWLGWRLEGPAALIAEAAEGALRLHLLWRGPSGWKDGGWVQDNGQPFSCTKNGVDAAFAHGRLLVLGPAKDGFRAGWAAVGERPVIAWERGFGIGNLIAQKWTTWASTAAMVLVLMSIMLLRRDQLMGAATLPPGLVIAPPLRRVFAMLIDILPAAIVIAWWWWPTYQDFGNHLLSESQFSFDDMQRLYFTSDMWWLDMLMKGIATIYCFGWEAMTGTTPGKYLVGCRVLDQSGQPATLKQIALRNIVRAPELAFGFMTMCTLFLMLVASVRRQRIGDILAGTLVVAPSIGQPAPVQEAGGPPHGDDGAPGES